MFALRKVSISKVALLGFPNTLPWPFTFRAVGPESSDSATVYVELNSQCGVLVLGSVVKVPGKL